MYFEYSETDLKNLQKKDKHISKVINEVGYIQRNINTNTFEYLILSIISQQISNKAAKTVCNRFKNLLVDVTPSNILNKSDNELQSCGLSFRKVSYIKGVANSYDEIDFENLHKLCNEEIIKKLTSLNGVGVWTAEMVLIFSLNKLDVLSFGDLIIKKAIENLYNIDKVTKKEFNKYKQLYSPYGSIASLYLWEYGSKLQK